MRYFKNFSRLPLTWSCQFNGRTYPFTDSAIASPVHSICNHQISNWCRDIFKYNTVIS